MDLARVSQVKAFISSTNNKLDVVIQTLVSSVSAQAEREMKRTAQIGTYTEYFDTYRLEKIFALKAWPITQICSALYDPEGVFDSNAETLDSDDYTAFRNGESGEIKIRFYPGTYASSLKFVYVGGMATDTADFITRFPDINQAVITQVVFELQNRNNVGGESVSAGGSSVSTSSAPGLLPGVQRTLQKYRLGS